MSKEDFVIHMIKQTDNYPFVDPISLESAQSIINNIFPELQPEGITAEDIVTIWNQKINDPAVMEG